METINVQKAKARAKHKRGGFFFGMIDCLKNSKSGIIQIDNRNEYCFKYSVCACLHKDDEKREHPNRHKQYEKYFDRYDWSGMNFPVGTRDIEKFMNNNPNIVIKAYSLRVENIHMTKKQLLDSKKPFYFPTYTPEELKDKKVVYMLFLFPSEEVIADRLNKNNYDVGHIVPIVDINKFLYGWRSDKNCEYICDCCGSTFRTEKLRDEHINKGCYVDKTGQYKLDNKNLFFNSHSCCPRNPFIGYSDIETNMEKLGAEDDWDTEHIPQAIENTLCY